jgi:hypothetical protein
VSDDDDVRARHSRALARVDYNVQAVVVRSPKRLSRSGAWIVICHKHRAIFIHIQKTGGNSVSAALGMSGVEPDKHWRASELKAACDPAIWDGYFKFSFVRNPWARLVSWYTMVEALRPLFEAGTKLNRFQTVALSRCSSFGDFLELMDEDIVDDDGAKWIYRNQLDYLTDDEGQLLVDFVGRTETLASDFASILDRLHGPPAPLAYLNSTRHEAYQGYYTPAQARMVAERYARDIERFGYSFAGSHPEPDHADGAYAEGCARHQLAHENKV